MANEWVDVTNQHLPQEGEWVDAKDQPPQKTHSSGGAGRTALETYGDTATLGYLPQLQAGASKIMYPVLNAVTGNNVQPDSYIQERDENRARIEQQEKDNPSAALAGKGLGFAANMLVPGGVWGMAAQAALANPGDVKGEYSGLQAEDRLRNAGIAALLGKSLGVAGPALGKSADYVMQKAANIRRMRPGAGQELLDAGIWGTKGGMLNQIKKALPGAGKELENAVAGVKEPVDVSDIINSLRQKADAYKINGVIPENTSGLHSKYTQLADDLQAMSGAEGRMSADNLSRFKQGQGDVAHTVSGAEGSSDSSRAALEAMRGARSKLSEAAGEPYEASNAKLSALIRGKQGLEKASPLLADISQAAALAGLGYKLDGAEGAIGGLALKTGLGKSSAAHLLNLLGKGATVAAPEAARLYSLFGTNKD